MSDKYKLLRRPADYRPFLHHPDPIIRDWAVHCMEAQYPGQTADSLAHLLPDSDDHLQISAAMAIGEEGAARFEEALLAVWPTSKGAVRNWFTATLGRLRSPALLPELIAALDAVPGHPLPAGKDGGLGWQFPHSVAIAAGYYPDEAARSALWRLLERYPVDDRLAFNLVEGLLRHIGPDEMPRLLRRMWHLEGDDHRYWRGLNALSQAANLSELAQYLVEPTANGWFHVLDCLDYWFDEEIPLSDTFGKAMEASSARDYADALSHILAELERIAAARKDDLIGWTRQWQQGERPGGYQWRRVLAHRIVAAAAAHPPSRAETYLEVVALGLALLGEAAVDQNDAAALEAAPNQMFRQATLLSILDSPWQNVLSDIVEQVAVLGPAVMPHLIETLEDEEEESEWGCLRVLAVIEKIGRKHPGAADDAVPAILDLIYLDQGDALLEAASAALIAIGPGAVEAIGERLGQDYVYDIYAGGALGQIPTEASVEIWLNWVMQKEALEEMDWENLADLGHPAAIPFLRDEFEWYDNPHLCTALHKLAVVTGYRGPEAIHWQTVAMQEYRRCRELEKSSAWPMAETGPEERDVKG